MSSGDVDAAEIPGASTSARLNIFASSDVTPTRFISVVLAYSPLISVAFIRIAPSTRVSSLERETSYYLLSLFLFSPSYYFSVRVCAIARDKSRGRDPRCEMRNSRRLTSRRSHGVAGGRDIFTGDIFVRLDVRKQHIRPARGRYSAGEIVSIYGHYAGTRID